MKEAVIKVEGMMCEHCVSAVTKAVTALQGVAAVTVSLEAGTATVQYDPAKVSVEEIKAAIEDQGYDVI
ncbi:MAG: copper chaperone CopZ [Oscillospiraceae bacterium]|jgi:copper chaperone|nr:copper chaperone CopZ [Oscillospiraceae bacterium]